MRFGYQILNSNVYGDQPFHASNGSAPVTDAERIRAEFDLIEIADKLGLDTIWASEHHFSHYMTSPSLTQILAHVAGRTTNVDVGTAVIVLPWHDPVRVAEEIAMLDIMLGGRTLFVGFGRGASTKEFEGFRVPMEESRPRYNEALEIVRRALANERFSFDGEFFNIPEMEIHPRPLSKDLADRMYCAFMNPESLEVAARQGLGALFAVMRSVEEYPAEVGKFNAIRAGAGLPRLATKAAAFVYCAESVAQAEEEGLQYLLDYYASLEEHYNWADDKYKKIKSYEFYAELGEERAKASIDDMKGTLIDLALFGTPELIVEKVEALGVASQCDEVISPFIYGKMPYEKAEKMTRLFLTEALPKIQKLPVTLG
jgi:alkanesulfonate monooxygenase SsuD/methylene tetrahydromethanopterin reductase-like flavin-dependent oxidoreductase (luciferase family)